MVKIFNFKNNITDGGILVASLMATNFFNFLFNAVLGRVLSLEQFSLLTLVNTLWFIITIFLNSLASTTNNRTAYLSGKRGEIISQGFRNFMTKNSARMSLILSAIWLSMIPFFSWLFHTDQSQIFIILAPTIVFGTLTAVNRGFFQGKIAFIKAAIIILAESVTRLSTALLFIMLGFKEYVYLSFPISIIVAFFVSSLFVSRLRSYKYNYAYVFPRRLLMATFFTVISSSAFLAVDLLYARHFLSEASSGAYSLLSLVGKMVFFLGSILNVFILTYASRDMGENRSTVGNFYRILALNLILMLVGFIGLGIFGDILIPLLFGEKSKIILSFLIPYTAGISLFTISNSFATYHLAKQQFIFAYAGMFVALISIFGFTIWNRNITDFVNIILITGSLNVLINILLHFLYKDDASYVDEEDFEYVKKKYSEATNPISVAINIPAFNEGQNIKNLLTQIFLQKQIGFKIEKIIVASDGSTDNTVNIAKKFRYKNVVVIDGKENLGQNYRQNEMISLTNTDVLVMLNADILLGDDESLYRLIAPVMRGADLSAQWAKPVKPTTFFEKILKAGFDLKYFTYTHHKRGNNIYTCVGHMRAMSRKFYSTVTFPAISEGEDQYLYLTCISGGYKYEYAGSVNSYFKLPDNLNDYKIYAKRIFQTQTKFGDIFSVNLTLKERFIPKRLLIRGLLQGLIKHPIHVPLYVILHLVIQRWALRQPLNSKQVFEVSSSTKKIIQLRE